MIKEFLRDETGMKAVEWAVIGVILVAAGAIAYRGIGSVVQNRISTMNHEVELKDAHTVRSPTPTGP